MTASHCSQCGTRLASVQLDGKAVQRCPACGVVAWRNPVPVGMALIQHQGRLVLVRRGRAPLADYWAPPAGYVECGESVPQAIVREAREECGLEIALDGLLGIHSQADVDVIILAYAAHSVGGALLAGDDASEVVAVARGGMPRQPAPVSGTSLDHWFYQVICSTTADWR